MGRENPPSLKNYLSVTSKKPSSALKAMRAPMCISAAKGVKSVSSEVISIPKPKT